MRKPRLLFKWFGLLLLLAAFTAYVLSVSKPGAEIIGCLEGCAQTPSSWGDGRYQLISLNMLHGYPNFTHLEQRTALLLAEIERLQPDFVLLQEVPWTNDHGNLADQIAQVGNFNYVYLRANGNKQLIEFEEGSVILSRYPLSNVRFAELRPSASLFDNRIVLAATAKTPHGSIDLFVTHLTDDNPPVNQAQAETLAAFVQTEAQHPAIVAGDFNATETSAQIKLLTQQWQDSYRLLHPNELGATCCVTDLTTSTNEVLKTRVDYLFLVPTTAQTVEVVAIEQLFEQPFEMANGRLWLSDHAGLLATIQIEPQP